MKLSFDYKGIKVTYYLTYKKAKAISINVTEDGRVDVVAPRGTSVYSVMDKVKGNAPWIIRELYGKSQIDVQPTLLEQYTYLGKNYKLEVNVTDEAEEAKVKMARGKFVVETPSEDPSVIRAAIVEWYRQKVSAKLKERMKELSETFKIMPKTLKVIDDQNILFKANSEEIIANVKIGIIPTEVMDYLIISSLCRINNEDSASEAKQLESLIPSFEKCKEWIDTNKGELVL